MADSSIRKFVATDLWKFKFVGRPVISPDGTKVAYTVSRIIEEKNGYGVNIWIYDVEKKSSSQFTWGKGQDTSPKWSPDGTSLGFLSDRGEDKNQVWVMPVCGGEARQVTKAVGGVSEFEWSPCSKRVAVVTKWDGAPKEEKDPKKYTSDVKVYSRIKYKFNGGGFWDHKWTHIWVFDVATGQGTQLTSGDFNDESPTWSPDGKEIAFVSARFEDNDVVNLKELWAVNAKTKELRLIVKGKGPINSPEWHKDGKLIGYTGHDNAVTSTTNEHLYMVEAKGGEPKDLLLGHDISIGSGVTGDMHYAVGASDWFFTGCGCAAVFAVAEHGQCNVYSVTLEGAVKKELDFGGEIIAFDVAENGDVYMAFGDCYHPGDIYYVAKGADKVRLTAVNKEILSEVELATVDKLTLKGKDDWDIEAWLMKPPGFDPKKKYPMVLEIHGGPHAMFGNAFFFEFQLLVAKGFLVLFTNPRGSAGYGQAFKTACRGDWGGGDYEDIMRCVDQVIAMGFVDEANMGVTGGSYGGYMTNWIVTHTNRFKAAATQRCVSNLYSFYGTSDIGFTFIDNEIYGNAWDNHELLLKHSPFFYVKNITTPLLILHSEEDHRCPIEQGEQMYTALKKMKKDTEFVRFPGENHELSRSGKPYHRIERLERILGWMEKKILGK